jgi:hypothetical protein
MIRSSQTRTQRSDLGGIRGELTDYDHHRLLAALAAAGSGQRVIAIS